MITPNNFVNQMRMSERISFSDPDIAIKNAERVIAQLLVDLGYHEGIKIYKNLIDEYRSEKLILKFKEEESYNS